MILKKGIKDLVSEANQAVRTILIDEAVAKIDDPDPLFVDIRDVRELEREGMIPGAFHAPRGMLEFWIDPDSPYYKKVFGSRKFFYFYCASGWRSALATKTAQDMGLEDVAHIEGGFNNWKQVGGPVSERFKVVAK
ncbi:MAG: rhodanese-like domain-containing protein [Proteobacteria bacterium]|nr:rhodanese-like domain-containing protein [Pseudomonadota bacterium]